MSKSAKVFMNTRIKELLEMTTEELWEGLKTTPNSECALNAIAIDNLLEYARLYFDGTMKIWIDAEDSLEVW